MRIAVDAMGGDHAPGEVIRGAVAAAESQEDEIILVGNEEIISAELGNMGKGLNPKNLMVLHAPEFIAMDDHPAMALRKKKGSSIEVATRLVRTGEAQALVSAGSTGAQMAAALLTLGRIEGIARPAIAAVVPAITGSQLILDVGANLDCRPHYLLQFAQMGAVYAQKILGMATPRVGLLNIGAERTKGNDLTLAAYSLLAESGLNFVGNIEPREIFTGAADVVVCDGFVGNCILKSAEGLGDDLFNMLRRGLASRPLARMGLAWAMPALRPLLDKMDYAGYGGAPLLGVKGVSLVCHGSSRARTIEHAIRVARRCVASNFVEELGRSFLGTSKEVNSCALPE